MSPRTSPAAPSPRGPRWSWSATSRATGLLILVEQSATHALGGTPELILVGAGMVLLAGRDGLAFLSMVLPRGGSEPPRDSR